MLLLRSLLALTVAVALFQSSVVQSSAMAQQSDTSAQAEVEQGSEILLDLAPEDGAHSDHADNEHGSHSTTDNDPNHANLSDPRWEVVDFRTDLALFTAVVFLLLLSALYYAAWGPIMSGLEKREQRIADQIASAEKAAADAAAKLSEYQSKLAAASAEAQAIVADARKDAESAGQKLIAAAQEDATRLRERATADIESAKRVALGEIAEQSTQVAMSLAQRVVGREVKAEDHQSLIQEMLAKLPSKN